MRYASRALALGVYVVLAFAGCRTQGGDADVARRLQQTRADCSQYYPDPELLAALDAATLSSLKDPTLVRARVFGHSRRLLVEWIESQPTIDAIRLVSEESTSWDIQIDRLYLDENRRTAQQHVLFRFTRSFEDEQDAWRKLAGLVRQHGRLVLLRRGQVVSNEVPLQLVSSETGPSTAPAGD